MFTDIHCHIVPGIDDGAKNTTESLTMARVAEDDGTKAIIATPHQLGTNNAVTAKAIKSGVDSLQEKLHSENI